jgi:ABC-type transport system substrate-binding protein
MKKVVLAFSLIVMFLMLSITFAELPNQQPGPLFDEMRTKIIIDPTAAVAALKAGEAFAFRTTSLAILEDLQSSGFRIETHTLLGVIWDWINLDRPALRDVNFRRAIAHLIPKEAVLEDFYGITGQYAIGHIPSATGHYYNPDLPDVTVFDPELAAYMLDQAGYTKGTDGWRIDPATGVKMEELRVAVIQESAEGYKAFCTRWVDEMIEIGIPARMDYSTNAGSQFYIKWFINRDFDIFMLGDIASTTDLQTFGRDFVTGGRYNVMNYSNPEFDALWNIYQTSLNDTEIVLAGYRMQEILVEDLPAIPLFTPIDAYAVSSDLTGWTSKSIQAPFYWIGVKSTLRLHWRSGVGGTFTYVEAAEPGSLIHGYDTTLSAVHYTCYVCDILMDPNPFTGAPQPWVATSYTIVPWSSAELGVASGSKITFSIRDDFYWHDDVKFTAYDIEFAAKYARDYHIANLNEALKDFVDATAVNETAVEFYYNRSSLQIVNVLGTIPYITSYPKHLYNPNATLYGLPEGPMGLQETGKPGVPSPSTFAAAFVPHPDPPADKPWLTCFIGIGPWIFKSYEYGIGADFIANRDYPITLLVTDINIDRTVNIIDISAAAKAFGTGPSDSRWDAIADVNGDSAINIIDLAMVAKDFGKKY